MFVIYWMTEEASSDTDVSYFNFKRSLHLNAAVNLVWNLISHIPSVPSWEVSNTINICPISMKFTRSTLNDRQYTHGKNHINRKRLSYEFWYWTKTAITFGEKCTLSTNCMESPYYCDRFASQLMEFNVFVNISPWWYLRHLGTPWKSVMVVHHFCPVPVSLLSRERR